MPTYEYDCINCGIIEIFHSIKDSNHSICPKCLSDGLKKIISSGAAIIIRGKSVSQYNDCKVSKNWRDVNGELHKVTSSDGHKKSATPFVRKTRSDLEIENIKKRDEIKRKSKRIQQSRARFNSKKL